MRCAPLVFRFLLFAGLVSGCTDKLALPSTEDWLLAEKSYPVVLDSTSRDGHLIVQNGLMKRVFRFSPNLATVRFENTSIDQSYLRAIKPEARVQLDSVWFDVGGLVNQPNHAYLLDAWVEEMDTEPASFLFEGYAVGPIVPHLEWKRRRYASNKTWPLPGKEIAFDFKAPTESSAYAGLRLEVIYQFYDNLPLLSKRIRLHNNTGKSVVINSFVNEVLALVEQESAVDPRTDWRKPPIHIQSDYAFRGMDPYTSNRTSFWLPDPDYLTQVNYERKTPVLFESKPALGPAFVIQPGGSFASFRTYELMFDSDDRERRGLALRKMYRTVAPWITEAPIFMHVRNSDSASIRRAVDQAAEVGFEMVIITFGSGFDMENESPEYISTIKAEVEYAHAKGIELGGYSLLSSRRISEEDDVINAETGERGGTIFGNAPCLRSNWGEAYFQKLERFIEMTGIDVLEHDGPYPGDFCASETHPYHRGVGDSQWNQWKRTTDFYGWALSKGVYLNVPDFYFLNGSTKTGMGYRETNWSLPRDQQIIHARQNIFDGTWEKTPAMGWMFVPLVEYHGGGEAATLEPLSEHIDAYEAHLANLFGAGVMAAYRGPRLYDTEETKQVVKKWVDFYKKYRGILDSDIIHLKRADGRSLDGILHVNPSLEDKGLAVFYNPTDQDIVKTFTLPLYYTGIDRQARIREQEGDFRKYTLARDYTVSLDVKVPAGGVNWYLIRE